MTSLWKLLLCCVTSFIVFQLVIVTVSGNKCTDVLSRQEVHEVTLKEPCQEKYNARCGWLSLDYCTFYRQTMCDRKKNQTLTIYYIKTICCKGFILTPNGSCVKKRPGVDYSHETQFPQPSVDGDFVDDSEHVRREPEEKVEISGGGYAGIACGLLLIMAITAFIIIAVRKKKSRKAANQKDPTREVMYIGPSTTGNHSVNITGVPLRRQTSLTPSSRAATPSSSRMTTPPTSPVVKSNPPIAVEGAAAIPFLTSADKDVSADDIPETDI